MHVSSRIDCRTGRSALAAAVITVAVAIGPAGVLWAVERAEPLPKELESVGIDEHPGAKLPLNLTFTAEDGREVRLGDYFVAGRPVILNLGYFRCPMLCSLILNAMVDGLKEVPWTPGTEFEIVTVSINPAETPALARLKKQNYLNEYGRAGAADGWHFLTGSQENIARLAEVVGFRYRWDERQQQFAHPAGLFFATPDGRMARYLYGVNFPARTLRLALTEAGEGNIGTTTDQILLFCYHYDPQAQRYVVAANNIMRLGGLTTALVLGAWLFTWWRRSDRQRSRNDAADERQAGGGGAAR